MASRRHDIEALLVDQLIDGLDERESGELESLLAENREVDRYAFERTAAALFLVANAGPRESMPEELGRKLEADARALFETGSKVDD